MSNENKTEASQALSGSKEKYWSELTTDQKVERMRLVVKEQNVAIPLQCHDTPRRVGRPSSNDVWF